MLRTPGLVHLRVFEHSPAFRRELHRSQEGDLDGCSEARRKVQG